MNYLAHLALSLKNPALMVGNFIADDIPRKEERHLPEDIMQGIILHRQIDEFTDDQEAFKKAVIQLRPYHRKYASVVIDILNDHLLSRNWTQFYNEDEKDFHGFVYKAMSDQVDRLPPKASLHVQTLLEYEYLKAYGSKAGIENVLARMDKRTRFPSDFKSAVVHLYRDFDFFEEQFVILYQSIVDHINIIRAQQ